MSAAKHAEHDSAIMQPGYEAGRDRGRRGTRQMRPSEVEIETETTPFKGDWQEKSHAVPFAGKQWVMGPPKKNWDRRPASPGLKWYKHYDSPESLKNGRVLVIDYVKKSHSKEGTRKVVAQEIGHLEGLQKLYANNERCSSAVLRILHVQCADWAIDFLLKKFNMNSRDDLVGTDFGRYVKYKRPERRGGKPFLSGKSWKTIHDPWRQVSRTSFGLDYLKHYECPKDPRKRGGDSQEKMMELNYYDEHDNPKYGYDVYVQRLSCYVQHMDEGSGIPKSSDIRNPYAEDGNGRQNHKYVPRLDQLDNSNTIIIFENSESGSIADTLISAQSTWEGRWRRLPFYLAFEGVDVSNDDQMALECSKIVLQDIWKAVTDNWDTFLDASNSHMSILEDRIYEQPADESRAPELWTNSSMWLKVERLVAIHLAVVHEMRTNLRDLSDDDGWLEGTPDDMDKIRELAQDDLVKPTDSLSDLMYKSVGIRDSRHSLQLNLSMWRLSWITFIFLPLTFISSFFGMNVDTFQNNPALRYYFASAVPMMFLVLVMYFIFKNYFALDRQTPYQRGIWDQHFHNLANDYPELWSRGGPRKNIRPKTPIGQVKWNLVQQWNRPEKTIRMGREDSEWSDLGAWDQFKCQMTRRWTAQLKSWKETAGQGNNSDGKISSSASTTSLNDPKLVDNNYKIGNGGMIRPDETHGNDKMNYAGAAEALDLAPVPQVAFQALPPGMLEVPIPYQQRTSIPLQQHQRRTSAGMNSTASGSGGAGSGYRPSSSGSSGNRNSGILVEEEGPDWLSKWALAAAAAGRRRRGQSSRREEVSVPASEGGRRGDDKEDTGKASGHADEDPPISPTNIPAPAPAPATPSNDPNEHHEHDHSTNVGNTPTDQTDNSNSNHAGILF